MAGVNQAGMSQQHLSQLQTQPVGGMRRQIPQQHAPPRDVGRQVGGLNKCLWCPKHSNVLQLQKL